MRRTHRLVLLFGMLVLALSVSWGAPEKSSTDTLNSVVKQAEKVKDGDIEKLLNEQLDKNTASSQLKSLEKGKLPDAGKMLDKSKLPADLKKNLAKDLNEKDVNKAYAHVQKEGIKQVVRHLIPKPIVIIGYLLGATALLMLLSSKLIRFIGRPLANAINRIGEKSPLPEPEVRYSWYYREAVKRMPEAPRMRR